MSRIKNEYIRVPFCPVRASWMFSSDVVEPLEAALNSSPLLAVTAVCNLTVLMAFHLKLSMIRYWNTSIIFNITEVVLNLHTFRTCSCLFGCRWNISSQEIQNNCLLHWSHFSLAVIEPHNSHFNPSARNEQSGLIDIGNANTKIWILTGTFDLLRIRILLIGEIDDFIIGIGGNFLRRQHGWLIDFRRFLTNWIIHILHSEDEFWMK